MEKTDRKRREGLIYSDFVWTHTSPENGASVGERDISGLMEKSASLSFSMNEKILMRRIEQLMHKPKSLQEEIQYRHCLIKAFSNMCKRITENAVFGGDELDLLEAENCLNGEDRAHVDATGVGPIKQFRRLLSLMLLRDFRTLLMFLKSLLCNNKHVVAGVLDEFYKYVQQHYQKPTQCTLCQMMTRVDLSLVLDELLSDDEDWLPFYIKVSQNVSVGPNSKYWRELVKRVISYDLHVNVASVITKALSACGFHSDIVKMLLLDKHLQRNSFLCRCHEIDKNRNDLMRNYLINNEESSQALDERKSSAISHDGIHVINNANTRETGFFRQRRIVPNKTLPRMAETRSENRTKKLFASKSKEAGILKEIFVQCPKGSHSENRNARSEIFGLRERTVNRSLRRACGPRTLETVKKHRQFEENRFHAGGYGNDEVGEMLFSLNSNGNECYEDHANRTQQKVKIATQDCDQLFLLKTNMQERNEMKKPENFQCSEIKPTLNDSKTHLYATFEWDGAVPNDNHHLAENEIIPTLIRRELEKKMETQKKNCWSGNPPNGAGCKSDTCENNPLQMACLKEYMFDENFSKTTIHKPDEEVIEDEGIHSSFKTHSYSSIDRQTDLSLSTDKQNAEEFKLNVLENEIKASGLDHRMALLKCEYDGGNDSGISRCQSPQHFVNDDSSITNDKGTGLKLTKDDSSITKDKETWLKLTKHDSHTSFSYGSEVQRISRDAFTGNERHRGGRQMLLFDFLILVIFAISLFNYVALYSI